MRTKLLFLSSIAIFLSMACIMAAITTPPPLVLEWEKLFIEESVFPADWEMRPYEVCISAPLDSGCDNYVAQAFIYEQSATRYAGEEIRFYKNKEAAVAAYSEWFDTAFYQCTSETAYREPENIIFQSETANQLDIGCNHKLESGRRQCKFLARYERFIVRFSLWGLGPTDEALFQSALEAIDRKMSVYGQQPPVPDTE